MTRTQMASYCLLASAFILGAMLVVKASQFVNNPVMANTSATKGTIAQVTAEATSKRNVLVVLNSTNNRLLAYETDNNRREIKLIASLDISRVVDAAINAANRNNPATKSRTGR